LPRYHHRAVLSFCFALKGIFACHRTWYESTKIGAKHRVGKYLRQFKGQALNGILLPIDEHVDKIEVHGFQPTKQGSMARNIQGDFWPPWSASNKPIKRFEWAHWALRSSAKHGRK
jgi:hypothetical protein